MYVPFPVAVSCSFLLSVTPSSLICTFSPPFSLCRLIALGQCYLFVIGGTKNKACLVLSYHAIVLSATVRSPIVIIESDALMRLEAHLNIDLLITAYTEVCESIFLWIIRP